MNYISLKRFIYGLSALLVGIIIGMVISSSRQGVEKETRSFDENEDGKTDVEYVHTNGIVVRTLHDRNFDGAWDYWEWFEEGRIVRAESDDDFDGKVDGWVTYKDGAIHLSKHDLDGNGVADHANKFRFGILLAAITRPNGATNGVRVEFYRHGVPEKQYRDIDADGLLEILVTYDHFGNEVRQEKLNPPLGPRQFKLD